MAFCDLTHADRTFSSFLLARWMPASTASSKLFEEEAMISVTLAMDMQFLQAFSRRVVNSRGAPPLRYAPGRDDRDERRTSPLLSPAGEGSLASLVADQA